MPRTLSTALPTALSSSSMALGFEGSRRRRGIFSRLVRCACTVEEDAKPTALPMSRTVGGEPYLAEYLRMKSKISCWRLVRSMPGYLRCRVDDALQRTCVRNVAPAEDGCKLRAFQPIGREAAPGI